MPRSILSGLRSAQRRSNMELFALGRRTLRHGYATLRAPEAACGPTCRSVAGGPVRHALPYRSVNGLWRHQYGTSNRQRSGSVHEHRERRCRFFIGQIGNQQEVVVSECIVKRFERAAQSLDGSPQCLAAPCATLLDQTRDACLGLARSKQILGHFFLRQVLGGALMMVACAVSVKAPESYAKTPS